MDILLKIIHVTVAIFIILVVLVQGGNQGGMGAAFGGGNSQGVFGASGATSFLGKLTYGAGLVFMLTSITLAIREGGGHRIGLPDRIEQIETEKAAPAETAAPVNPEAAPVTP